jgi:hypothetical protein
VPPSGDSSQAENALKKQKFFGSFFQKRTASFTLAFARHAPGSMRVRKTARAASV